RNFWHSLENQLRRTKQRKKCLAAVDIAKAAAGREHCSTASENNVLRKRGTIANAGAIVHTNGVTNRRLKKDEFERLGALEAEKVDVGKSLQLRRDVEIDSGVREKNTRVDEVGLALVFARAQRRNEASGRGEQHTRTGQAKSLAIPETEK